LANTCVGDPGTSSAPVHFLLRSPNQNFIHQHYRGTPRGFPSPAWAAPHGQTSGGDFVSRRSAVRGRDFRDHPDLAASDAARCRAECRSGTGHHLRALPPGSPAGVQTRVSLRPTRLPPRLLLGYSLLLLWCSLVLLRRSLLCSLVLRRLLWAVLVVSLPSALSEQIIATAGEGMRRADRASAR
jgi:hypothetical protein